MHWLPGLSLALLLGQSGADGTRAQTNAAEAPPSAAAETDDEAGEAEDRRLLPRAKTLGGTQFWADAYLFRDWRIQQNVVTGHYRLLDGDNRRYTYGTENECLAELAKIRKARKLEPAGRESVLLLHGLGRTRSAMASLGERLANEGFSVYLVGYPSTRLSIDSHADNLNRIVSRLEGTEKIHLVGHSMGGLVIRSFLSKHSKKRIGRVVMLGTPNHGAERADRWADNWAFTMLLGPGAQQLVTGEEGIADHLPDTLPVEFGILAGGKGDDSGFSHTLPGDDDGTVTVASTRLAGARDFAVVRTFHTVIMNNKQVQDCCASFLKHGYFRSEAERAPIPSPKEPAPLRAEADAKSRTTR